MRITPEVIPPRQFHRGGWLRSSLPHAWYWFHRKPRKATRITTPAFMRTVDPPLRKLVRFLHERGIATTPSCSGHVLPREEVNAIYDSLRKEEEAIRHGGLQLRDVETGRRLRHQDSAFDLPWSRSQFRRKLISNQRHGVIGMRLGARKKARERLLDLKVAGVRVIERDRTVFILTEARSARAIGRIWDQVTRSVKAAVRGTASGSKLPPAGGSPPRATQRANARRAA